MSNTSRHNFPYNSSTVVGNIKGGYHENSFVSANAVLNIGLSEFLHIKPLPAVLTIPDLITIIMPYTF